jgi:hypothetical protein
MVFENYWDERYSSGGNSGAGSYGQELQKKLQLLSGLNIKSISEIGCGDFNFGKHLMAMYPESTYWGYDTSDVIITRNKKDYPQYNFLPSTDLPALPQADLVLCVDVLFYLLTDEELERMYQLLERLHTKYLAVTAYEYDQTENLGSHVRIRKFDYKRFGEPWIREIVQEDGSLYFYLFKKNGGIDLTKVSAVLNTKEVTYPKRVLESVSSFPFGEILIKTHSDSPHAKYELFEKAKHDLIYYQDDDAICPIEELAKLSKTDMINVTMKPEHFESYSKYRMTMGLGWGAIFSKSVLKELKRYTDIYGEDEIFKRDTEKLLTHLVYPQNRLVLPIQDLPSAYALDRLSMQPGHYDNMGKIIRRCKNI